MINKRSLSVFLLVAALCFSVPGLAKVIKEYYPNGNLMAEIELKGWKLHGISKAYYETGELMEETKYEKSKPLQKKVYYKSGKLKELWDYTKAVNPDEIAGVQYFDESGKLIEEKIVKKKKRKSKRTKKK